RAKQKFIDALLCGETSDEILKSVDGKKFLLEAKNLFESYSDGLKKTNSESKMEKINPSMDRHLFYLCEIEDLERGNNGRNWAISELAGRWNAWQRKYSTKTPKQLKTHNVHELWCDANICYNAAV